MLNSVNVRDWWKKQVLKFEKPYFASATTHLKPQSVTGRNFSVVFERGGLRFYCFEHQVDRDRFLTAFRRVYNARACGNPCE